MIMKHYIIVKWVNGCNKTELDKKARELYSSATSIKGVNQVEINENITARNNRYDLMIVLHMENYSLPIWDESQLHKQWKSEFGAMIDKKCIIDCE